LKEREKYTMKKMHTFMLVLALLAIAVVPVLANTYGTTDRGIVPAEYPGNFVSSDNDQVCYDMASLEYIGDWDMEMRGFKIDPPVDYDDGNVSTIISVDGKSLEWITVPGTQILAFIIKGGPNYHVYDYIDLPAGVVFDWSVSEWDKGLVSPLTSTGKKGTPSQPQISHYNVCYYPPPDGEFTGCTPGYWRNHIDRWVGVSPNALFSETFVVPDYLPGVTLLMAIDNPNTYGPFPFHATAALLNAYGGIPNADGTYVEYKYTVAEVIAMVQDAVSNDTTEATKDLFAAANEAGCPLGGTRACKVASCYIHPTIGLSK
jgi:hypothetical protein